MIVIIALLFFSILLLLFFLKVLPLGLSLRGMILTTVISGVLAVLAILGIKILPVWQLLIVVLFSLLIFAYFLEGRFHSSIFVKSVNQVSEIGVIKNKTNPSLDLNSMQNHQPVKKNGSVTDNSESFKFDQQIDEAIIHNQIQLPIEEKREATNSLVDNGDIEEFSIEPLSFDEKLLKDQANEKDSIDVYQELLERDIIDAEDKIENAQMEEINISPLNELFKEEVKQEAIAK